MQTALLVLHLMIATALVAVVLLQRSEGGALGIGGGGGGGFLTGRGTANLLTRTTAGLAAAFFTTSILLTLLAQHSSPPSSIFDRAPATSGAPAETVPGRTTPAPATAPPVAAPVAVFSTSCSSRRFRKTANVIGGARHRASLLICCLRALCGASARASLLGRFLTSGLDIACAPPMLQVYWLFCRALRLVPAPVPT